jgi:hypothetical protein
MQIAAKLTSCATAKVLDKAGTAILNDCCETKPAPGFLFPPKYRNCRLLPPKLTEGKGVGVWQSKILGAALLSLQKSVLAAFF